MEADIIEIHWTSGSLDEARRISRHLVQERMVASVQIIPWIESITLLDHQLETAQESKVILKARLEHFDKIRAIIEQSSKYEIPEIVWFKIDGINHPYREWLEDRSGK